MVHIHPSAQLINRGRVDHIGRISHRPQIPRSLLARMHFWPSCRIRSIAQERVCVMPTASIFFLSDIDGYFLSYLS